MIRVSAHYSLNRRLYCLLTLGMFRFFLFYKPCSFELLFFCSVSNGRGILFCWWSLKQCLFWRIRQMWLLPLLVDHDITLGLADSPNWSQCTLWTIDLSGIRLFGNCTVFLMSGGFPPSGHMHPAFCHFHNFLVFACLFGLFLARQLNYENKNRYGEQFQRQSYTE